MLHCTNTPCRKQLLWHLPSSNRRISPSRQRGYLTGVLCAITDKKLSSEIGAKGIFKKVLIFVMVGIAHIFDTQILGSAGYNGSALRTAVIFFYLSNEGVSILENAGHIGLPIPEKLKAVLKQLHGRDEEPPKPGDEI
jgi:toxin secretion/phage lysis holin